MSPLQEALLIVAGFIGTGLAAGWVLRRAIDRRTPSVEDAGPDPVAELRIAAVVAEYEWLACSSTECAHLERPHRRTYTELAACTWCGAITPTPSPTIPKGGTDA